MSALLSPVNFEIPSNEGRDKRSTLASAVTAHVRPRDVIHIAYSDARPNAAMNELVRQWAGRDPELTLVTAGLVSSQHALVETGVVDVSSDGLPAASTRRRGQVRLTAGDGVVAWQQDNGRPLQTVRVANVAGWRSGRLAYQGAYLADILADISRYVPEKFDLASDGIGTLRVTASFRAEEAADAVPAILKGLGLTSRQARDGVLFVDWPDE